MIDSKDNKILKILRSLKTKKGRDELNQFIVEGDKFVKEIPSEYKIDFFLISETYSLKNDISSLEAITDVYVTRSHFFKQVSSTVAPQGILAVVNKNKYDLQTLPLSNGFFLIAENLQDPGNAGTLIRTADAAGVDALILTKGSVDIYNPKVIRATAGSIFNIPIIEDMEILKVINYFKENKIKIYASHLKGVKFPYEVDFTEDIAIIIGNEGIGITKLASEKSDCLIKIPMIGRAESLNASIASGILLYEVVRQRINNL